MEAPIYQRSASRQLSSSYNCVCTSGKLYLSLSTAYLSHLRYDFFVTEWPKLPNKLLMQTYFGRLDGLLWKGNFDYLRLCPIFWPLFNPSTKSGNTLRDSIVLYEKHQNACKHIVMVKHLPHKVLLNQEHDYRVVKNMTHGDVYCYSVD